MSSDVILLAKGLQKIQEVVDLQRQNRRQSTAGAEDVHLFHDLEIQLSRDLTQRRHKDDKPFCRQICRLFDERKENCFQPKWTTPLTTTTTHKVSPKTSSKRETKRFVAVLESKRENNIVVKKSSAEDPKVDTRRRQTLKSDAILDVKRKREKYYNCEDIQRYIERKRNERENKKTKIQSIVENIVSKDDNKDDKTDDRHDTEEYKNKALEDIKSDSKDDNKDDNKDDTKDDFKDETIKVLENIKSDSKDDIRDDIRDDNNDDTNKALEDIKDDNKDDENNDSKDDTNCDDSVVSLSSNEGIEEKVRKVVNKAVLEVPDWDTLWRRVYRSSVVCRFDVVFPKRKETEISVSERVSQIINERFDHMISDVIRSPKVSSQDIFRLTSDLEVNDDDTDDVSSLQTETGTVGPEVVADLDISSLIGHNCQQLFGCHGNQQLLDSIQLSSSGTAGTPFLHFLFDFCKEVSKEIPKWPPNSGQLADHVMRKLAEMMSPKRTRPDVRRIGFLAFCRQNRKRDFVDSVLCREISAERWTDLRPEMDAILLRITEMIFRELISETFLFIKNVTKKRLENK